MEKDTDQIVGYEFDGTPITRTELISRLEEAEKDIEKGDYITLEDLIKESKGW